MSVMGDIPGEFPEVVGKLVWHVLQKKKKKKVDFVSNKMEGGNPILKVVLWPRRWCTPWEAEAGGSL